MVVSIDTAGGGDASERRGRRTLADCALFFLVIWMTVAGARGASSPLSVEVQPISLRPRSQAPAFVEIKLHSESRGLLEGTLRLEVLGLGSELFKQEIPDLVIMPGNSSQRVLLPNSPREFVPEEVHFQFATKSGTYDLGRFPLTAPAVSIARQYLIAVCREGFVGNTHPSLTWRALRSERLMPEERRRYSTTLQTSPVWLKPEDLPTPPGLCAFDTVVLEEGGLAALSEKQLGDLAAWVEGGGSLCVAAPSAVDAEHLAFLNRMAASQKNPVPFARNPHGMVALSPSQENTATAPPEFLFRRPGVGRFVFAFQAPADEGAADEPKWRKATHFLAHSTEEGLMDPGAFDVSRSSYVYRSALVENLLMGNLPRTSRIIPLPLIISVFTIFIVIAGPGEWFVLGWLRRRRWTWLTFPLLAVACTLFMVRAAEHYLGTSDQRSSLIITDFSPEGNVLRENRFELLLAGRNRDLVSEVKQSLVVPLSNNESYPGSTFYSPGRSMRGISGMPRASFAPPIYEGRVPAHYTFRRSLAQWTPYLQHSLTFTPKSDLPRLHWEALREAPPRPTSFTTTTNSYGPENAISEKIGAQGWKVRVFRSHFEPGANPDYVELLTFGFGMQWPTAFSPGTRSDLLDVVLDHNEGDWIVVATRREEQLIQMQRCVYHFNSNE